MKKLAPIALFTYNRPEHTKRTVEALQKNYLAPESELFIFSDGAKNDDALSSVNEVRKYLKKISGFASVKIIEQEHNLGLANSIINGVTKIVNEYGKIIVVEDDIITSHYFLSYMNDALDLYENDETVCNIDGFLAPLEFNNMPQSFFMPLVEIWGWGTWKRAWKNFEPDAYKLLSELKAKGLEQGFDCDGEFPAHVEMLKAQAEGKVNSWAIRWFASNYILGKLSLSPGQTFTINIGMDGTGVHCAKIGDDSSLNGQLVTTYEPLKKIPVEINQEVWEAVKQARHNTLPKQKPFLFRALRKMYRVFKSFIK